MTLRDDVWHEVLSTLATQQKFKISELGFEDSQRHTVRRVLREMESRGYLKRDNKQSPFWQRGPQFEMLSSVIESRSK